MPKIIYFKLFHTFDIIRVFILLQSARMGDAYIRDTYGIAKESCGRGEEKPRPEPPEDKDPWEIIPPPYRWFEDPEEIFPRDPVTGEKYNLTKLIKKQRVQIPYK